MIDAILQGDVRSCLKQLEDESVQCCVTSPPYWGLRDYGCEGQIGLEPTPEAYVADLVDVFREVRRVLRNDGTLWLNLGDSYWGANWRGSEAEGTKQGTNRGASGEQHSLDAWNKENKHEHPYLKSKKKRGKVVSQHHAHQKTQKTGARR